MLKKVAAIGLIAALALSPLAALAQTDTAAPAAAAPADTSMKAKAPMKHKTHKTQEAHRQEEHGAGGARRGAGRSCRRADFKGPSPASFRAPPRLRTGRFFCARRLSRSLQPCEARRGRRASWPQRISGTSSPAPIPIPPPCASPRLAEARGVDLAWRPFLLAPIFGAQGWRDSPFNIYPAKGRYMWRDLERICAARGLPFRRPDPFPQNTLLAARVALALDHGTRAEFSRRAYAAEFGEGRPIADRALVARLLAELGLDPETALQRAESEANKARLKAECAARRRDRHFRRAQSRDRGRRAFLGRRPARTGPRLGGGSLIRRRSRRAGCLR